MASAPALGRGFRGCDAASCAAHPSELESRSETPNGQSAGTLTSGEALTGDQGRGLVDFIVRYTQIFLLLHRYDKGLLVEPEGMAGAKLPKVIEARRAIGELKTDLMARGQATDLFGHERDDGLAGLLGIWTRPCSSRQPICSVASLTHASCRLLHGSVTSAPRSCADRCNRSGRPCLRGSPSGSHPRASPGTS